MERLKSPIPDAINCSPQNSFTQIPNGLLRNPKISAKAKTILALLLSDKNGWKSHVELLATMMKEGKESIRTGLTELESFGYLKRIRFQDKVSKKYVGIFLAYTDKPNKFNMVDNLISLESMGYIPEMDKPDMAKPGCGSEVKKIITRAGTREINQKFIIPPEIEWVKEYCTQRKNNINPESFMDFYSSRGWKAGKTRMIDWQAAIRTWEQKEKENTSGTKYMKPFIIDDGIKYNLCSDGKYRHPVSGKIYRP